MSEWISVKDRLPENGCVICYTKCGCRVMGFIKKPWYGEYLQAKFFNKFDAWHSVIPAYMYPKLDYVEYKPLELAHEVTHWMPLPEPPK